MVRRRIDMIVGWIVFSIALAVYFKTLEPSVSFWDCGEFIACSSKLEIGHQPGAPFFLLLGRIFSIFAGENTGRIAYLINSISAIASAFTVLFLFKTITFLCERIFPVYNRITHILILAAAITGSLTCGFSDTFWFSAIEAEVYALSLFFTSFLFWAMLKWSENCRDNEKSGGVDRWIILIVYLMGLSIGIHLLNLLCIPALVAIYYYTKYKPTTKGFVFSQMVALIILLMIVFIIIPGIIKVTAWFDLLFVNGLGLPVNSGTLFWLVSVTGGLIFLIHHSHRKEKFLLNKIAVAVTVFLLGYSSYILLPVRASANPPINLNKTDNPFSLLQYISREQYVSRPLIYGPYYNAKVSGYKDRYTYIPDNSRYEKRQINGEYTFDKKEKTLFPRMSSFEPRDAEGYKKWADIRGNDPDFSNNLRYFFRYQVGYMYWRYFMWNFAGRQNDIQGTGNVMNGNWISGIPFIDKIRLGPQDSFPEWRKANKGRNEYYFLPLFLGLAGLLLHFRKQYKDFIPVLLFFFFTGLAIVVYLNEIPVTPRERDYAVGGSFYVFCIWIGIGAIALAMWLKRWIPERLAVTLAIPASFFIPILLAVENYDDHNRSGRYIARDVAYNYLNSCDKNAILFTNADNDTYPLWYAQEVEGIRTDVRVILAPFLTADWYIEKLGDWHNHAGPVNLVIDPEKYTSGDLNYIPFYKRTDQPVSAKGLLEFMGSNDPRAKIRTNRDTPLNYYPADKILLFNELPGIQPQTVVLKGGGMYKHLIAALDIIVANYAERPVYFLSTQLPEELGLTEYLQHDGFAYKLIPEKTSSADHLSTGKIRPESLYGKLMNRFRWGNMNDPDIYMDENSIRTASILGIRNAFARLAESLIQNGEHLKAVEVLDRCMKLMPQQTVPYDIFVLRIILAYIQAGAADQADQIITDYKQILLQDMEYYRSLNPALSRQLSYEINYTVYALEKISELEKGLRPNV